MTRSLLLATARRFVELRSFLDHLTILAAVIVLGIPALAMAQFGTGADGPAVIVGTVTLTGTKNYTDLTVSPGAVLNTSGFTVYVSGTLLNQGTITDLQSGGNGGFGGPGGDGGFGWSPHVSPEGSGNGVSGSSPAISGAGNGGRGGNGGSGGGGAWDDANSRMAPGGAGGNGGIGGKGGGYVRIYASVLNNQGIIHANGFSGQNGNPGNFGGSVSYTEAVFFSRDMVGGGGGGGGGGYGGYGGSALAYYGTLTNAGTITASGGIGGSGQNGGLGMNQSFAAGPSQNQESGGAPGLNGGQGGSSAIDVNPSQSGQNGGSGLPGIPGTAQLAAVGCCIGETGNVNKSVSETPDLSDLSLLISFFINTPTPSLPCIPEANINGSPATTPDLSDLSLLIAYLTVMPRPPLAVCP